MRTNLFGKTKDGQDVTEYIIENKNGMVIHLLDFGAILHRIYIPEEDDTKTDVALTCPDMEAYSVNDTYLGSTIAPNANRIGNAKLTIDGVEYHMEVNDGKNNLHTAFETGMNKRLWNAEKGDNRVTFSAKLEDGEYGLPGRRNLSVTYTLTDENEIKIDYKGTSTKNTIINMTNHTYFNLKGYGKGDILDHELWLKAKTFTMPDDGGIPTGEIAEVAGTPLDFTVMKPIRRDNDITNPIMALVNGYDHNYCIDKWTGEIQKVAEVKEPQSGRIMEVYTDLPGIQFYSGNYINNTAGKGGKVFQKNYGLCLETQYYPDHINHPEFPQAVFGPGKEYKTTTIYKFIF
ncbi:MAG: galactose mutarotase [Lachnospiraceae bacterium]|nr:galactose mutarotase [Lachnospiraceae bacterium]